MAQFVQLSRPPPPCQRSLSPIEAGRAAASRSVLCKDRNPPSTARLHSPPPLSQVEILEMETCHRRPRQPATVYL